MDEQNQNWKIGLLFFIGLLLLMVLSFVTQELPLLSSQSSLSVYFREVHGISVGDPVHVMGVKRGSISDISILPDEEKKRLDLKDDFHVKVDLSLYDAPQRIWESKALYQVRIRSDSMIGGNYLSIERVSSEAPLAQEMQRETPVYGVASKTGIEGISQWFSDNKPKLDRLVQAVTTTSEDIRSLTTQVKEGKGVLGRLIQDEKLGDKLSTTFTKFQEVSEQLSQVTSSIRKEKGTAWKLIQDDSLYRELNAFSKSARAISERIEKGEGTLGRLVSDEKLASDIQKLADSSRSIANKIDEGKGTVGKLVNEETVYNDLEQITSNTRQITQKIRDGKGAVGTMVQDEETGEDLRKTIDDMQKAAKSIKNISEKVDQGSGTMGRLVNEDDLYSKAEDSLEGINKLAGSVNRLRTFLGAETKHFVESNHSIHKVYLRAHPRPNKFLHVGGAFFDLDYPDSNVRFQDGVRNQQDNTFVEPEVMLGYKFFDRRLTARVGILEGKLGGALDYNTTLPLLDSPLQISLEGRSAFDDISDDKLDEETTSPLMRLGASTRFGQYFYADAGVNRLLGDRELYFGVGIEYEDKDIRNFFSLLNLAN